MKRTLCVVFISFILPLMAVAFPSPKGHVNDFANIFPDKGEQQLDQRLSAYEKQTSIEIAVVTTSSLDGDSVDSWAYQLFNKWGIGKSGANNGLLIVVAPNERKWRIEVGEGLEWIVPDATASRMGHKHLPNAFRAEDYIGGTTALTENLMDHIGHMSSEEFAAMKTKRLEEAERKREEKAEQGRALVFALGIIAAIGGALGALWYALKKAASWWKEVKRLRVLRNKMQKELLALYSAKELQHNALAKLPDLGNLEPWIANDINNKVEALKEIDREIETLYTEAEKVKKSDPDECESLVSHLKGKLNASETLHASIEMRHERVEVVRNKATKDVVDLRSALEALTKRYTSMQDDFDLSADIVGCSVNPEEVETLISALEKDLEKRGVGANDTSDAIIDRAQTLLRRIEERKWALHDIAAKKDSYEADFPRLARGRNALEPLIEETQKAFSELKEIAPERVWQEHASSAASAGGTRGIVLDSIKKARTEYTARNFATAASVVATGLAAIAGLTTLRSSINATKEKVIRAKEQIRHTEAQFDAEERKANRKVKESDVGGTAKQKLRDAKEKAASAAQLLQEEGITDYLLVTALFTEAMMLARAAYKQAVSDIDAAERKRRREREEREEEKRRRRRRRASMASSSSSRSSSGSSFGGFGGGSSRGGGASGGW